ncbi:MAG: DNA replication/repair protein RecF [Clostridia bacterium]|nr:DNA replication/repair protein RecF [Clostridia bacterium]
MYVNRFEIKNFRNIEHVKFQADRGINIIYGENAQGKTNIIEAIWLFTGAKSFRGAKDSQMIRIGETAAELKLSFFSENREQAASIKIENKRTAWLNEIELSAANALAGTVQAIVFSPQDLALVNDGPSARRKMLNLGIGLIYPSYIEKIKQYNHTLQQRNALLKTIKYNESMYSCLQDYDAALCKQGAEIIKIRKQYVERLRQELPLIYNGLADEKEKLDIAYQTTADENPEAYALKLKKQENEDLKNLTTSVGPHRDELLITTDGRESRIYASQGQRRSAALTIKLAQAALIKNLTKEQPIALLDDVLSELDEKRQNYILNHIKNWQVFITCCDPSHIQRLTKGKIFKIENGRLAEE